MMMFEKKNNVEIEYISLEIEDVEESVAEEVKRYYTAKLDSFVRVGPHKHFIPEKYRSEGVRIYNMNWRPDDVIISTYPRSGTTWTQELVWLILNNLNYEEAASTYLTERYTHLELPVLFGDDILKRFKEENKNCTLKLMSVESLATSGITILDTKPSPRFVKTHLPYSLLPPSTVDKCKNVYVARDPRDVAVSAYYYSKMMRFLGYIGDFKTFWKHFVNNTVLYTPFFPHLLQAWKFRNHPNMLFLFYEEMVEDLPNVVRRVAKFFDKQYTEQQITTLCEHLNFNNFKNNKSCNADFVLNVMGMRVKGETSFIRQGKSGGWRDYFDEDMTKEADKWIAENLKDTDFRFPT